MRANKYGFAILPFDLTPTKVQSVLRENTELFATKISRLGEGFDFRTYLINDEWVFRFPTTTSAADAMSEECSVLKSLSLPTAIPEIKYWLDRPFGYPLPVSGYRFIRGESLESQDFTSCERTRLAMELGRTLQAIHVASDKHNTRVASKTPHLSSEISSYLDVDLIGLTSSEKLAVTQFIQSCSHDDVESTSVRIHGDLGVEHIITNSNSQLKGLIDWSNSTYGDRFKDFIGLWGWGGDDFVVQVLSHYEVLPQHFNWEYTRVHGLTYCIHRLNYAHAKNYKETRILRNRLRKRIEETIGMRPYDLP